MGTTSQTYSDFVAFRGRQNPCLEGLSRFLESAPHRARHSCKIHTVGYGDGLSHEEELSALKFSSTSLQPPPANHGRVVIIEDIHPTVLETLATALDIDPIFFADYLFTQYDDIESSPAPPSSALPPSRLLSDQSSFHVHYQQIVSLSAIGAAANDFPWTLRTVGNVERQVKRLVDLPGRQLGILRGCYSILKRTFDESWLAIILIDSTTAHLADARSIHSRTGFEWRPLHGGSERFEPPITFSSFQSISGRHQGPSDYFLHGLVPYLAANLLVEPTLLSLSYYPLRAIIGEWMLYTQTLARFLKYYEVSIQRRDTTIVGKYEIIDLQKWRHRAIQSNAKLHATRCFIARNATFEKDKEQWELVLGDLDWIANSVRIYATAFEGTIPLIPIVVQLADSRQSMTEAVDVKRLTWVALVFVPLSWVASLFSMTEEFLPGHYRFWVYVAVAVPLSLILVAGSVVPSFWRAYRTIS